ncbi:hypothetical protein WJX77_005042 [Trebouxia sp. C0004]
MTSIGNADGGHVGLSPYPADSSTCKSSLMCMACCNTLTTWCYSLQELEGEWFAAPHAKRKGPASQHHKLLHETQT